MSFEDTKQLSKESRGWCGLCGKDAYQSDLRAYDGLCYECFVYENKFKEPLPMTLELALSLVGKEIWVIVRHATEDAKRLGRDTEGSSGKVWRIEYGEPSHWIVFGDGWAVRIDGVIAWGYSGIE